ncbi:hypothetical protein HMN09_01134400 [Mycena chlorophos]|uniref:CxC2-like cysteine cluster KDZ transposase-associated domain-containing protein n=1 Tax=Mycena chlorophos TaxID=658473 RepID=A0A8H6VVV6_MYCCL|nr:hypothetical protein HMN09_01134400 [Mycena chlorophos]
MSSTFASRSGRRKRAQAQPNRSSANETTHEFTMNDLLESNMPPMETHVERMSNDRKRRFQDVVPVEPPSPMKRQATRTAADSAATEEPAGLPFSPADELYNLDLDGSYNEYPESLGAGSSAKRNPLGQVKPSSTTATIIFAFFCGMTVEELRTVRLVLRVKGPKPSTAATSVWTAVFSAKRAALLLTSATHFTTSLYRWVENANFFTRTSLKALGLRIQFGHDGARCPLRRAGCEDFVVLHHNGVHEVAVDFCGCVDRDDEYAQLLRRRWFPATTGRPQTCATFECLELFHLLSLKAKTTAYDFYNVLELRTNGYGIQPPNRYPAFLRTMRIYRHVVLLKRRGRFGHTGSRVADTPIGGLALRCPACPRPGVNLPEGWENAAPEDRCLYIMFLALDACFRLKRRMISSERWDPALGAGWAYMVETAAYRAYLLTMTDQKEMSTCSGLAALDYANTKFSCGYSATGVGMGVCARHELVMPTGVGDLQKGERYANMDYIFASIFRHLHLLLRIILSYDIACQWWKELKARLLLLPPLVRLQLALDFIRFVVPKMHIGGHTLNCQHKYSLNLVPGSGQTDAEGIERAWAVVGGLAGSTRVMGPGSRSDALDDHWSFWNWTKVVGLGATLRRRLDVAEVELEKQRAAFQHFSEEQAESVLEWKRMVEEFEADGSRKNPYESTMKGMSEAQVHQQLEEAEAAAEKSAPQMRIHDVGPVAFVVAGLEAEDEQRRIRVQVALKKADSTSSKTKLRSMRKKLNRNLDRLCGLQATYTPAALRTFPYSYPRALMAPPPSNSPPAGAPGNLLLELVAIEQQLRGPQCRTALVQLRNQLHIKVRLLIYKRNHSRHQGMNTRSRAVVARNESHIRLHSEKFQMAWMALFWMVGGVEADVGWPKLEKADIRCMQEAETLSRKQAERQRKEQNQRAREARLVDEEELPAPKVNDNDDIIEDEYDPERFTEGQNRAVMSWIWTTTGIEGTDGEMREALRVEWCKSWARVRRWDEEVRILKEEQRGLPVSFKHEAEEWKARAAAVPLDEVSVGVGEGMIAQHINAFFSIVSLAYPLPVASANSSAQPLVPLVDLPQAQSTLLHRISPPTWSLKTGQFAFPCSHVSHLGSLGRLGEADKDAGRYTVNKVLVGQALPTRRPCSALTPPPTLRSSLVACASVLRARRTMSKSTYQGCGETTAPLKNKVAPSQQAPPPSLPNVFLPMSALPSASGPSAALESDSTLQAQISHLQASVDNLVVQSYLMAQQPTVRPSRDFTTEGVVRLLNDMLESVQSMQPGLMRPAVAYAPYPPLLPWAPEPPMPRQHQPNIFSESSDRYASVYAAAH